MSSRALPSSRVLQEAAEWFACLADPAANETDRARWQTWLSAHPDHAEAWKRVETITRDMTPLADSGGVARRVLGRSRTAGRRKALRSIAALVATGCGAFAATRLPWEEWRHALALGHADYRTATGEIHAWTLPDGGRIWLGSRGALDVEYSPGLRRLTLHAGDLLIETASDAARPFVVDTRHGRMRALGTRFAVRADDAASRVDVFEGAIELTPRDGESTRRIVSAGEHAIFDSGHVMTTGAALSSRGAWARGILISDNLRLDELIAELARWHPLPITCAPGIAAIRVVGAYPLRDLDRTLAALQASLPIEVRRDASGASIVAADSGTSNRR